MTAPAALRTRTSWFGIVLDAPDARELAGFYRQVLGWQMFDESDTWVTLAPAEDAGYYLAFATEPRHVRPVWPSAPGEQQMQSHLDIAVDDLPGAVAFALAAGGVLADHQPQDDVRVLLDPAGHPFCLYLDPDCR